MTNALFRGNYTYCATYAAFDSGADIDGISKDRFEILSSVPFGVVHSADSFHRLISPVYEPYMGVKRACEILNMDYVSIGVNDKGEARRFLLNRISKGPVLIGPVEMSKLNYLPLSQIYNSVPHYISLYQDKERKIRVKDSEGVMDCALDIDDFMMMWDSIDLIESNSRYNIGYIACRGELSNERQQIVCAFNNCYENLEYARTLEQGPLAFEKLWETICNTAENKYQNFLFFDMEILIQRKNLMLLFVDLTKKYLVYDYERIKRIVSDQIDIAAHINYITRNENIKKYYSLFHELGILENELTNVIGEVHSSGCRYN